MPSKEDVCLVQDNLRTELISSDVEDLVFHIKHNLQLKSKPATLFSKQQRRVSPYSAPCKSGRDRDSATGHTASSCKYCLQKSSSKSASDSSDPYEILTLLSKGILISEAVKRLQMDAMNQRPKKTDFYESDDLEAKFEAV